MVVAVGGVIVMPLEDWVRHSRHDMFLYDWQTLIAGGLALVAGLITVWVINKQIKTTVRLERERVASELDTLRKSLAIEFRLQVGRARVAYEGLYGLGFMPKAPITTRMVESKSLVFAPSIYLANAGKIGLLGAEAMDVVIVYNLLQLARDGAARLMNFRPPDDISPAVVVATADVFLEACSYARSVLPRLRTGDPLHDARDEALIQKINDDLAARPDA